MILLRESELKRTNLLMTQDMRNAIQSYAILEQNGEISTTAMDLLNFGARLCLDSDHPSLVAGLIKSNYKLIKDGRNGKPIMLFLNDLDGVLFNQSAILLSLAPKSKAYRYFIAIGIARRFDDLEQVATVSKDLKHLMFQVNRII